MTLDSTLHPGMNPREHLRRHKERGPIRYYYTVNDVAAAAGCSIPTVYRHVKLGTLKLERLASVIAFICARAVKPRRS